ncbi:MAG: hypothetical protein J6J26_08645 [Bacteroides sp.]|nr:hypothetical protein [Bacteroides sp.]
MKKRITNYELRANCSIDEAALAVVQKLEDKISEDLYMIFNESMLGFRSDIQLVIAEALHDAVCYEWENYTDMVNIDMMLNSIYRMIDEELGRV